LAATRIRSFTLSNLSDHILLNNGVRRTLSLAHSALPDAPVVPDTPRASLIDRARLTIVAASRFVSRPAPALPAEPATGQA
jgi:hypothetical protein